MSVRTSLPENRKPPLKYIALGDSYTIGEGVEEHERWPNQLIKKFSAHGIAFEAPTIIAQTGWTTQNLISEIRQRNITQTFDLVSLLIGVNNQYQGKNIMDYADGFKNLLDISIAFAGKNKKNVFVLSIPDYSVTPFASSKDTLKITSEIKAYNRTNKEITEKLGLKYFDITPLSLKAQNDASLLADDNLHPSGKMYTEWVEFIFDDLSKTLKR